MPQVTLWRIYATHLNITIVTLFSNDTCPSQYIYLCSTFVFVKGRKVIKSPLSIKFYQNSKLKIETNFNISSIRFFRNLYVNTFWIVKLLTKLFNDLP